MIRQTSILAYCDLGERISQRHSAILDCLMGCSLTDQEIARKLGYYDPNVVRPRRNELYKLGVIVMDGKRSCRVTGKTCITWKIK